MSSCSWLLSSTNRIVGRASVPALARDTLMAELVIFATYLFISLVP